MSDALRTIITDWLDPVGIVLGLIALVPIFWTWWDVVFGRRRRERRWFAEIRRQPGERPALLIVDLLPGKEIRASVENYRLVQPALADIAEERIGIVRRDAALRPEDMPGLQEDLRIVAAQLLKAGADCIHCFYAGPAVAAALVGAEFANGARVLLYHHEGSGYTNFGPLRSRAF